MLSRPSFRSSLVFSINSLILPGFPLTSFHLVEPSLFAFLFAQLENVNKLHSFFIKTSKIRP